MTEPGTADTPDELAAVICKARTRYLQAHTTLGRVGKIEDWARSNGFAPESGMAAMRADLERQLDALVPAIRTAEARLSAMVPAAAEQLLARAQAAGPARDTESGDDGYQAIAMLYGILMGQDSLEAKRALMATVFGG